MVKRKKFNWKKEKREITWNVINSLLAGSLVLLGSLTTGVLTYTGLFLSVIAALIVAITRFKEYWESEKKEYKNYAFKFL